MSLDIRYWLFGKLVKNLSKKPEMFGIVMVLEKIQCEFSFLDTNTNESCSSYLTGLAFSFILFKKIFEWKT